jgi:hypothetical protein
MRRALGISFLFAAALTTVANARPVDQSQGLRPELPANPEQSVSDASAKGLAFAPGGACPAPDTVDYGGTFWAADSGRWEAIRDSVWTFDTGIGSSINTGANPNKPVGYHQQMEGWFGIDQTLNPLPYFRRHGTCKINGNFSLWAGVTDAEANALCFANGQGYGNGWHMEVAKTFAYGGAGNVTLEYDYTHEIENNFDFAYVEVTPNPDPGGGTVEVANYTDVGGGTETITLTPGTTLPNVAGSVTITFVMDSDGSYSDEDGLNPTVCGAFVVDDIDLSGAITDFTDFEAGMNGWTALVPNTGVGDLSNIVNRNTDLPPPVTFCPCGVRDSVLVFHDALDQHPLDQDNIVAAPWINLKRGGNTVDLGRPGRLMLYNVYAEMPLANYVFVQIRARWYPSVCAATGLVYRTPFRDQNVIFYFGEAPFCTPLGLTQLRDYSGVIETAAEQIQVAWGMLNLCATAPFGVPCTGVTNTTPWLDNIRLGIYGAATAPNLTVLTFDVLQDNFAEDGTLNPASTGRIDPNTIKNGSTPGPGTIMRDTLVARGDGGNTEVRLVFKVRPGPFTNAGALAAWAAAGNFTAEPGIGAGWVSARMDTAEQGGTQALPLGWMTTHHESDGGFAGTDRTPDPQDPSQNENEILPDHILTPGARVDYFIAARYLPGDPRNPGGECQWYVTPDTTGGRYHEIEILPSSMGADTSWNCTLYVDHKDDRSLFDQQLEEAGLTASLGSGSNNAEGTRYDRFDNETPSSGQLSFGRPIQTEYGATITQTFAYKNIVWHSAALSSVQLTDEDANILGPWLTLRGVGTDRRFWGSGSGLATSMNGSGEPSTVNFMLTVLGVIRTCDTIRNVNCPNPSALDSTFCLPTSAVGGSAFATTTPTNVRGNGCPDLESFDLLNRNVAVLTTLGQLNYVKGGVNRNFASVTNHNVIDVDYKTVLDGFAVGRARTTPASPNIAVLCTVTGASTARTDNVLDWFASSLSCKIPSGIVDVPDLGSPKPPQFRAALGNAYPNPMNPTTRIQFTNGTENGRVTVAIFDVTGRLVKNLVDGNMSAGVHEVVWDGTFEDGQSAPSGMYFYKMIGDNGAFSASKKLVMMK